jgi:3',5'-cyclic AMP phosphodiesterase CpdA
MQIKVVRFILLLAIILTACDRIYFPPYPQDEKWSFVVFGDTRLGYDIFGQLSRNIGHLEPAPRAAFCCGDIVDISTNEADWLRFADSAKPISQRMPIFFARGNHEGNDTASERFFREFTGIRSDSFYLTHIEENTLFIVLDIWRRGEEHAILNGQLNWLQNKLDSASADTSILNIFIFMHQPPYPQGKHSGENLANADELHQLFMKHKKIRAIFAGHDHMFNKYVKDSVIYITTGGGGSPLYLGYGGEYHHFVKVTFCKNSLRINLRTIGISNQIFDDFDL